VSILPSEPWLAVPIAWLVFVGTGYAVKWLHGKLREGPAWRPHAAMKLAVLGVAFGLAALQGMSLADLGFRAPERGVWGTAIGLGLLLGAVGTLVMLSMGLRGLRKAIGKHSFPSIVLWFWIVSSVAEEIFCLVSLLPSGVLFGTLHLVMLSAGISRGSVAVIVVSTTALGLLAAWALAATGSLYPAIAAHVAFNVGGPIGGILYASGYRVATGRKLQLGDG
jgi:membrane protease YdiL (CAAX protease family)